MKKIIVGLSGGVDSSVAAYLLKSQGFHVEGLFMKNWEQDDRPGFCAAEQDLKDATSVAETLGITLHTINFSDIYWNQVFQYMLDEYAQARTPNPDILCNKEIKFKVFLKHALTLGADGIATGHYARVEQTGHKTRLLKARDRDKDQTYFLSAVPQEALKQVIFPVGDYLKSEIRALAKKLNLTTHDKKDSTGLCFIGEKKFKSFLSEYMLAKPGPIHNLEGHTLGMHDGLMFYTLGQRQGLNIGGAKHGTAEPWYVVDKDIQNNILLVAQGSEHPMLYAQGLICSSIHWITEEYTLPHTCYAKTRYRQIEQPCLISPPDEHKKHVIMFSTPQRAITPGQYIVFYEKNQCLGSAVIEEMIR